MTDYESFPLLDALELEILMHKEAHFAASFDAMLTYYKEDGVGCMPDFSIATIEKLKALEESSKKNLAEMLLPDSAKEEVAKAKKMYISLRDAYNKDDALPKLVSDLILTEENYPEKEIEALIKEKKAFDSLVKIISSEPFYDPIYPGYGRTPIFAAKCLQKIGNPDALIPLFEALSEDNFFTDEAIIDAICSFKENATEFLLKRLQSMPLSKENEQAAICLTHFEASEKIGKSCIKLLEDKNLLLKKPTLAVYLILSCTKLSKDDQDKFKKLTHDKSFPNHLEMDAKLIMRAWQ